MINSKNKIINNEFDNQEDYIYFLESLRDINHIVHESDNLKSMMSDVLDKTLAVLRCDRAWLLYPCDPDAKKWSIPMSRNTPEYPGLTPADDIPMTPEAGEVFEIALSKKGPIIFDSVTKRNIPLSEEYGTKSQMVMAIYPKVGKPWVFGVHQCSHLRVWSESKSDVKLFEEIGYRISDALNNLLLLQDLTVKITELEKVNELMVGRELKMIEMKKDLEKAIGGKM